METGGQQQQRHIVSLACNSTALYDFLPCDVFHLSPNKRIRCKATTKSWQTDCEISQVNIISKKKKKVKWWGRKEKLAEQSQMCIQTSSSCLFKRKMIIRTCFLFSFYYCFLKGSSSHSLESADAKGNFQIRRKHAERDLGIFIMNWEKFQLFLSLSSPRRNKLY